MGLPVVYVFRHALAWSHGRKPQGWWMGQPESHSHETQGVWVQLAARFRRAKEYQEEFLLYTVWSNEKIARGLGANAWYRNPAVWEDPLVARLRLDPRLSRPPHDYGCMNPHAWQPPQLNPYERRPLNPNQIFYVSPDGGLQMTLGQLRNLGQPMFDEAWITLLCTWPPTQEAHRMGLSGGPSNTVELLLKWLGKHTHVDRPDYTAACLDMYFAGVGIREGGLTPQGASVRKNLGQSEPVTKPDAAKSKADREKLEAAQAEGRWFMSQERADQIEAAEKAERSAANQAAYERGDIARFELPEGFDKSKITWSRIGPGGKDLGGDVLYGYDYQGKFIGNRIQGIQDDSGSLLVLGSAAKLAKVGIGELAKGRAASPNPMVDPRHIAEMTANGVKFTPDKVIATARNASGQVIFLESGGPKAGLQHIVKAHAQDFANIGVPESRIPNTIINAASRGKIIGHQGVGTGRPIYQVVTDGQTQKIAVTIGNNGYIVGANPAGGL
jgi:filamentous hemagglutinin